MPETTKHYRCFLKFSLTSLVILSSTKSKTILRGEKKQAVCTYWSILVQQALLLKTSTGRLQVWCVKTTAGCGIHYSRMSQTRLWLFSVNLMAPTIPTRLSQRFPCVQNALRSNKECGGEVGSRTSHDQLLFRAWSKL